MTTSIAVFSSIIYILVLFLIAYYADAKAKQGKSIVNNPYTYALSLAVYCTAWTFYGSVGKAASLGGLTFLTIYIGPVLIAPLWIFIIKKIILISKSQRITSIADFISSRYGKSTTLGIIVTLIAVFGIIPYISIQLKAINASSTILAYQADWLGDLLDGSTFYRDKAFLIAGILTVFTILFGARHLDPNERHEGLIAAIAFESIWKLVAFLAIGIFVTFGIYNGFGDIFSQTYQDEELSKIFSINDSGVDSWSWSWLIILSMSAIMLLPRQFHVMVVENTDPKFVEKAAWLFPLYLLLINIFVIPIACGGLLHFPNGQVEPDNFVLSLPMHYGNDMLALFVYLGGLSAATGMVIVAVIALSIMISNNVVMPLLIQTSILKESTTQDLSKRLINIRRVSIVVVMLLAYIYFKYVSTEYPLVSIGLISFTAIAQFLPVVIGGLYWKGATKRGAIAALVSGFIIWVITLGWPTMAVAGLFSQDTIANGYFGISFLKPFALMGMDGTDHVAHSAFWSLLINCFVFISVSLNTKQQQIEITQADLFVDIEKYTQTGSDFEVIKRQAKFSEIEELMYRFLGKKSGKKILKSFAEKRKIDLSKMENANAEIINFAETHLAGAIGAASAKIILRSVVKEDSINLEEMLSILDRTQEVVLYSKALEKKSKELQATTSQLKIANKRLKALDELKADFITTVTHELRTPITSIKSLSKIIYDNQNLSAEKRGEYLNIVVSESERITRLINQVLDLEKVQSEAIDIKKEKLDFNDLVQKTCHGLEEILNQKGITYDFKFPEGELKTLGDFDRLTQVVLNILSNAIKFCDDENGKINLSLEKDKEIITLKITDNGDGIKLENQQLIFEKFTQLSSQKLGKPKGSGLGLFICKEILRQHDGEIFVKSTVGEGATFVIKIPFLN